MNARDALGAMEDDLGRASCLLALIRSVLESGGELAADAKAGLYVVVCEAEDAIARVEATRLKVLSLYAGPVTPNSGSTDAAHGTHLSAWRSAC